MQKLFIKAPAKINFGLNIISRREDGFHNLETIFFPLELSDKLTFSKSNEFRFTSSNHEIQNNLSNLIIKAKELLEDYCRQKFSVEIDLVKNIPIGAGLGGGSSDAAAVLVSLNELFKLNISKEKLYQFALILGSDVPFFLKPVPSFAEGRGEIIQPVNFEIKEPILIVNPGIHVSTKWAFENITPQKPEFSLRNLIAVKEVSPEQLRGLIVNDFESVVFERYHVIREIKEDMYNEGADFVLMSGSGSTIYGIFNSLEKAEAAEKKFSNKYFTFISLKDK